MTWQVLHHPLSLELPPTLRHIYVPPRGLEQALHSELYSETFSSGIFCSLRHGEYVEKTVPLAQGIMYIVNSL